MAALSTFHSLLSKNSSTQQSNFKTNPRFLISVSCQTHKTIDSKAKKEKEKENKGLLQLFGDVGKAGKELKDSLSPKQKGDWKDLMLMSLSFAVYVYISQKLVCAYCVWMSLSKQSW
ncbi:unnamed protein product [Ilex paraguariensis]|uniref:Uncharacterized protein n=1 Tax=Ilex paraguariensis TaxID=185542 RepID=A0ABC8URB4_9AQUA